MEEFNLLVSKVVGYISTTNILGYNLGGLFFTFAVMGLTLELFRKKGKN